MPKKGSKTEKAATEKKPVEKKIKKTTSADGDKKRRRKANYSSYSSYLFKVLKQVHPGKHFVTLRIVVAPPFVVTRIVWDEY